MRDLAALAERLRLVRLAERRFLELSALERAVVGPMLLDRLAADMSQGTGPDCAPGQEESHPDSPPPLHRKSPADDKS